MLVEATRNQLSFAEEFNQIGIEEEQQLQIVISQHLMN